MHCCPLTAIVLIPVKSVTVAEPPRISIDDTIILVANLTAKRIILIHRLGLGERTLPEEHEDKMSNGSPSDADDFQPCVSERRVKLELRCKLS